MSIEIREHQLGKDVKDFLRFPSIIFKDDPHYIAPLEFELSERLSPKKNPFFDHAEAAIFTAWKNGKLVGRVSASICHEHLKRYDDDVGFFGFFDTIDDQEVANALLTKAESWLKARGMKTMRGPFSFSINEETGLLVDGFDTSPAFLMPHHTRYQGNLAEGYGLAKAKDLFSWKYKTDEPPKRAQRAWAQVNAMPEVTFRSVDTSKMDEEIKHLVEIYNDAWNDNWGFVPWTDREVKELATMMKFVIDPDIAFFAEIDGRPVAVVVCMPNLNEAIKDINGKLFPFGWAKLLWRTKVKKLDSARLILLGIRSELRGKKRYGALSTALYAELTYRGIQRTKYKWAELSWTLEDNKPVNLGIKAMKGKVYRTYRVYEKAISHGA